MDAFLTSVSLLPEWKIYLTVSCLLLQGVVLAVFPEEVVALAMGMLWAKGTVSFGFSFLAIAIGILPANTASFWLADRFGMSLLGWAPFRWFLPKEKVEAALRYLHRYHLWVVFVTRFTPLVRGPVYIAAGLSELSLWNFVRVDFLAACLQIPILLICGW